jgi:hypothetical protein
MTDSLDIRDAWLPCSRVAGLQPVHFSYETTLQRPPWLDHFATVHLLQSGDLAMMDPINRYRVKVVLYH